jgi:MATE family multidrug resistance protein
MFLRLLPSLRDRWQRENGYRMVLAVAIPLIFSTGSMSIRMFVDRMFLTWYSPEAVAAGMPAGMLYSTILCPFYGITAYAGTFVAQYYGAGRKERIGPSMWQGIHVAIIGGVMAAALIPAAGSIFGAFGHEPKVQEYENTYFSILCWGAFPALATSAMSAFYSGRGQTWQVMAVSMAGDVVNLVLDYALIFGRWGFPEMGVSGAAIATVASVCASLLIYIVMLARPANERQYRTISGWRPDRELFLRLMRFGMPNGILFTLDTAGFAVFVLIIGRLGTATLAATNIAFNISTLAFMPVWGIGMATSVLVGQAIGREQPDMAERATYSAFHLGLVYMVSICTLYAMLPGAFVAPFAAQSDAATFAGIRGVTTTALRFVAAYSVFDAVGIIFSSAIRGAGDTRFVMAAIGVSIVLVIVVPTYLALVVFDTGVLVAWSLVTAYTVVLAAAFSWRFVQGKWRTMRVIEPAPAPENGSGG